MRVFVTGATGFIGSVVVDELLKAGHQVLGLARSDAGAKSLAVAGAEVHRGSIEDLESMRTGAAASDGVIHLAFIHDFSKFVEICEADRLVIEAIGSVLAGSDRPFIVTSGTGLANTVPGQPASEDNAVINSSVIPRAASEEAAASVAARGVNVSMSPEEAATHFGWLAMFVGRDAPASSAQTQKRLGLHPTGPGMIADLERMNW